MCGIAGWLRVGGESPELVTLARMGRALAHRGPDGAGVYVDGPCGLAHERLAIVDPDGGAQPMIRRPSAGRGAPRAGVFALVANGEIYNHRSLRRDLLRRGHRFATRCDNEVLLHGYVEFGDDLPRQLNGMFAFAVWDGRAGRAMLARDLTGQKPLYYAHLPDGSLVFASELTAMLEHPAIARRVDPRALSLYLTYEYVPSPYSAIAGVRKLPPGHRMIWQDGALEISRYADDPFERARRPYRVLGEEELIETLRERLSRSVKRRLMSDVELGLFLSGGLDSAAVLAAMAEHVDPRAIQTFTIGFDEPSYDESRYASEVAARFGTRHQVRTMSADDLLDLLPTIRGWLDEPFADPSLVPTHFLSRFASEHVKVALGGDGGDELLLGYETFLADTAARYYRLAPIWLRRQLEQGVARLPVGAGSLPLDFALQRFARGASAPDAPTRHLRWLSSVLPGEADDPLRGELRQAVSRAEIERVMAEPYERYEGLPHAQRLSAMYFASYFSNGILTKIDRASMAVGLEVRAPFLDPEVIAHAVALPPSLKLRAGLVTKYALKRALRDTLPAHLRHRRKHGFGMPVARWLRTALAGELRRALAPERLRVAGMLDPDVVTRLVEEHISGRRDHRKLLWTLLVFEWWRERHDVRL